MNYDLPESKVIFGGWYQRTTLHLSEIYEFFANANSRLDLDKTKLKNLHSVLNITHVTREIGYLEYLLAKTSDGIEIRYYEDGLYTLALYGHNLIDSRGILETYFSDKLNPAIGYIFSLGAPTPKILANIKTKHPTAISIVSLDPANYQIDENSFGKVYSKVASENLAVLKTNDYIIIAYKQGQQELADRIIDMQIFFREFKDHLEKYLNIHRKIWEEISNIKEQKYIVGKDVSKVRQRLDAYQKTVNLITNRINQMSAYASTRQSISKALGIEERLRQLFQYKFETLIDTLNYIKELWKMTTDYLNSAIQVLTEIRAQTANRTIQSLTLITSIGVISGLIINLSKDAFPTVKPVGLVYLIGLFVLGCLLNLAVLKIYQHKKYKLNISDRDKEI